MLVTAAGSLPGTDFRGSLQAMVEAVPLRVPLPELPERGVESAMVGRALGLVDGLAFDLQPAGWRLTDHPDAHHRRARALWRRDLDEAEEVLQGFDGTLKIAVAGPWTLAATVERPSGDRLLADHGARRELAQALEEAVNSLAEELGRRLPQLQLQWQIDEPCLVAVRSGAIPTASGFSRHRRVDDGELIRALSRLQPATLHCCASGRWLDLAGRAGYGSVHVDASRIGVEEVGEWVDGGGAVVLGVVDTSPPIRAGADVLVDNARRFTRELGVDDWLALAPACGLAGWSEGDVRWQLQQLQRAAELLDCDRG